MKVRFCPAVWLFSVLLLLPQVMPAQSSDNAWSVGILDQILAGLPRDAATARVSDMDIPVGVLKTWRDQLAGGPHAQLASASNITLWPGGNVYYTFSNNVSAAKQQAFTNAVKEWELFGN